MGVSSAVAHNITVPKLFKQLNGPESNESDQEEDECNGIDL